jgi:hypothetical protein
MNDKTNFSLSTQPSTRSEMKPPQLKDGGCDNVLPDQAYRTPQGMVTDEYAAMVE